MSDVHRGERPVGGATLVREAAAANGRRHVRVPASMFLDWQQLRGTYLETPRPALVKRLPVFC